MSCTVKYIENRYRDKYPKLADRLTDIHNQVFKKIGDSKVFRVYKNITEEKKYQFSRLGTKAIKQQQAVLKAIHEEYGAKITSAEYASPNHRTAKYVKVDVTPLERIEYEKILLEEEKMEQANELQERTNELIENNDYVQGENAPAYRNEDIFYQNSNQVKYNLKAVEILSSDKAKQIFDKGIKNNWSLDKILTELQVPKEQKQLILDLGKNNREDIITDLLANYSYTIEINTTKENIVKDNEIEGQEYFIVDNTTYFENGLNDGVQQYSKKINNEVINITKEEFEKAFKNKQFTNTQHYSNLTVPGGTNYTENEIATPGQLVEERPQGISTKQGVPELFETNPELANQVYEALGFNNLIKPTDKIIWGHPAIGKSYAAKKVKMIDFDSYKIGINRKYNLYIAPNLSDTELRTDDKTREARENWRYEKPENAELWNQFIRDVWQQAKEDAKKQGAILFASDLLVLREFGNEVDKALTMPDELFFERSRQRNNFIEGELGTRVWKGNLNKAVNNFKEKFGESKVINTEKYLSDLFITTEQKQQAQQLYSQYLESLNKPNTNPVLQGNQKEQVKKFAELQERLNNKEFLEGAKNAFESSEELQQYGTQEEYNDYIARVSLGIIKNPSSGEYNYTSQVKDIVYHGADEKIEYFTLDKKKNKEEKGLFFFGKRKSAQLWRDASFEEDNTKQGDLVTAILDLKNPRVEDFENKSAWDMKNYLIANPSKLTKEGKSLLNITFNKVDNNKAVIYANYLADGEKALKEILDTIARLHIYENFNSNNRKKELLREPVSGLMKLKSIIEDDLKKGISIEQQVKNKIKELSDFSFYNFLETLLKLTDKGAELNEKVSKDFKYKKLSSDIKRQIEEDKKRKLKLIEELKESGVENYNAILSGDALKSVLEEVEVKISEESIFNNLSKHYRNLLKTQIKEIKENFFIGELSKKGNPTDRNIFNRLTDDFIESFINEGQESITVQFLKDLSNETFINSKIQNLVRELERRLNILKNKKNGHYLMTVLNLKQYNEKVKDFPSNLKENQDGLIAINVDEFYVGRDNQYVVFEPEQIHILGSKQDIEGFKKFIKDNTKSVRKNAITPSIKGHAQFATDNGLMWSRTDERVQYGEQDIDNLLKIMENNKILQIKCS